MSTTLKSIAILGANSHIAKGLIVRFSAVSGVRLCLFTRSAAQTGAFLASVGNPACEICEGYRDFPDGDFAAVINCVGAGTPDKLGHDYSRWFTLTEEFDNRCLDYLRAHPAAAYVNFSSGAVYGSDWSEPADEHTVNRIEVNAIPVSAYYTIARLNAEAKHRALSHLRIADIRIFAYFSRFADLDSGYFITDAIKSARERKVFITGPEDMTRDYIHPDDLFILIRCILDDPVNAAFDAVSAAPVTKFAALDWLKTEYGLQYEIAADRRFDSPNGAKNVYYSRYNRAEQIGFKAKFSALEAIAGETGYFFRSKQSGDDQ